MVTDLFSSRSVFICLNSGTVTDSGAGFAHIWNTVHWVLLNEVTLIEQLNLNVKFHVCCCIFSYFICTVSSNSLWVHYTSNIRRQGFNEMQDATGWAAWLTFDPDVDLQFDSTDTTCCSLGPCVKMLITTCPLIVLFLLLKCVKHSVIRWTWQQLNETFSVLVYNKPGGTCI